MSKNNDNCNNLLEQYKIFVETSENLLERRANLTKTYIYILSGLLAVLALTLTEKNLINIHDFVLLIVSIVGLLLCFFWFINIMSFKQFSDAKFAVLHEMERDLPFPCFEREWTILGSGKDPKKYLKLTYIEKCIPILLALPYAFLTLYSLMKIF